MAEEKYTFKLLVEGNDDKHVVIALWNNAKLPETFDVIDCQSITKLLDNLRIRLTAPQTNERLGVVVDADDDISARWDAIKDRLSATGMYDCKNLTLPEDGLVLNPTSEDAPVVGVWIMPNNKLPGMLEDFVATLSEPDDPLMAKADNVLNELEAEKIQRYKVVHRAKAKIHSYLAWQDEPGKPMGVSITAHVLNPDSPSGIKFLEWLKRLFIQASFCHV
jgi:hypothetical protein